MLLYLSLVASLRLFKQKVAKGAKGIAIALANFAALSEAGV
jgi:hypothetical protein